mgnify:CR=1 FL=1
MDRFGEMETFARVVESGSFSRAARDLHMTPSAVSKMIGRLEDRLGVRLLSRTTRKLSLTEEGMALYEEIVPGVLEREQALLSEFSEEELNLLEQIIEKLHDRTEALQAADED